MYGAEQPRKRVCSGRTMARESKAKIAVSALGCSLYLPPQAAV